MKKITIPDHNAARELALYAANESSIFHSTITPALSNLSKKWKSGKYDSERACKLWERVAIVAAKRYASEFSNPSQWYVIFNAATRREAAKELEKSFFEDVSSVWR